MRHCLCHAAPSPIRRAQVLSVYDITIDTILLSYCQDKMLAKKAKAVYDAQGSFRLSRFIGAYKKPSNASSRLRSSSQRTSSQGQHQQDEGEQREQGPTAV